LKQSVDPALAETYVYLLTPGVVYNFKIIARNVHGESIFADSNTLVYQASQKPEKPAQVVTTLVTNVNVKVQWVPPFNNYKQIEQF